MDDRTTAGATGRGDRRALRGPAASLIDALAVSQVDGDVRLQARRIQDQGPVNACFSCALSTCLEAQDPAMPPLAPLFHFHHAALLWPGAMDVGIADETVAYGAFRSHGICRAELHDLPFTREAVAVEPVAAARLDARTRIPRVDENGANPWRPLFAGPLVEGRWSRALARRQPVLLIVHTNTAYWTMANGAAHVWTETRREAGGSLHAAALIGTTAERQAFIVQDSRGASFGSGGQWLLPYDLADGDAIDASFTLEYPD